MNIYSVYTSNVSYKPECQPKNLQLGSDTPVYLKHVRANSRQEALEKCLPNIRREELPKIKGLYLSVFVGIKNNPSECASRLHPFQIVVETGKVRCTLT